MRSSIACAAIAVSIAMVSSAAGQSTAPPATNAQPPAASASGVEELPAVEVVQDTPAKKAARAKKKAPAVSPLSSVSSAPPGVSSQSATGAPTAIPAAAPITVPSAVTNVTDTEIEHEGTGSIQQALQQYVPGIIVSDAAGNPLRSEVS